MNKVKKTERGWGGHFICGNRCRFRRNTLLELGEKRIVVSTVGLMENIHAKAGEPPIDTIGIERYYETMAFEAQKNGLYWDADVSKQISFESEWAICAENLDKLPEDSDNTANAMHDKVVEELAATMRRNVQ